MWGSTMDAFLREAMLGRGGTRQLMENERIVSGSLGEGHSVLAERLLMLCGWGLVSANCIRWLAEGAREDGLEIDAIKKLSELGGRGVYAGNCRRDLLRRFCGDVEVPKPYELSIPVSNKRKEIIWAHTSILPLTALVDCLWSKYHGVFVRMFGNSPRIFWNSVSPDDPKLKRLRVMTEVLGWQDIYYPYLIHGDAGRFTNKNSNSLMVVSVKGLLGTKFDLGVVPLFALPKSAGASVEIDGVVHSTFARLWKQAVAFLNALFAGIHLEHDIDEKNFPGALHLARLAGQLICGGRAKFVCWGICGDMDFLSNDLELPHFNAVEPCMFCPISRSLDSAFPLTDMRLDAAWKRHLMPIESGCATLPSTHPAMSIIWGC